MNQTKIKKINNIKKFNISNTNTNKLNKLNQKNIIKIKNKINLNSNNNDKINKEQNLISGSIKKTGITYKDSIKSYQSSILKNKKGTFIKINNY